MGCSPTVPKHLSGLGPSPLAAKTDLHQMGNCILQAHQAFVHVENNAVDMERKMTFQQGVSGNPHGNRHRTRHLLNQEFMQALLLNFRHQGKKAIEKVARNQPAAYLKILALLVPREMKVEHAGGVKAMTDEQLEQGIEAIQRMLEARAPGDRAKLIEGTAETVALPAPDPDDSPSDRTRSWMRRTPRSGRGSASRGSACRRLLALDLTMSGRDKWRFAGIGRGSASRARCHRRQAPNITMLAGQSARSCRDSRIRCLCRVMDWSGAEVAMRRCTLYRKGVLIS